MKNKKGYSLIEIVIGLAIITIFLVYTGSLINASYTNYRLIVQRNEAMKFAISEMEEVLCADDVRPSVTGHTRENMNSKVTIEKAKKDDSIEYDSVFIVTVEVEYKKSANDTKTYSLELQSLKVVQ